MADAVESEELEVHEALLLNSSLSASMHSAYHFIFRSVGIRRLRL